MNTASNNGASAPLIKADMSAFLRSVRSEISTLLNSSDEALRKKLGDVYAAATVLSHDRDQWQTFCEQEEWRTFRGKPKPIESYQANALKYAIRYAVGFDGVSANQAAYRYSKALEGCWTQGVSPAEVPEFIKKSGGLEKLKRKNRKTEKGFTVVFDMEHHAKTIANCDVGIDAILLVQFEKGTEDKCTARIILGDGVKDGIPSMTRFEEKFKKWRANNRKSRVSG